MTTSLQPGDLVANKYCVQQLLGVGGMGSVVSATDPLLERNVAIKLLSTEHRKNPEVVARFLQEARAVAKLQSEHVIRVFDMGIRDDGAPFIVMEMLRGADLAQVIESEGSLCVSDALTFILQASEAVAEAHVHGIVHRDLKPANLFLSRHPDGTSRVKVLDFGISKLTTTPETVHPSLTQTTLTMGSPMYMPPEQLRSAKDVDGRADIWALGVILYELLVGKPPFNAESLPELSAKILTESPAPPSTLIGTALAAGLDAIILKALEKDRSTRFQSVGAFVLALEPYAPKRLRSVIESTLRIQQTSNLVGGHSALSRTSLPPPPSKALGLARTAAAWGKNAKTAIQRSSTNPVRWAAAALVLLGIVTALAVGSSTVRIQLEHQPEAAAAPITVAEVPRQVKPAPKRENPRTKAPAKQDHEAVEPPRTIDGGVGSTVSNAKMPKAKVRRRQRSRKPAQARSVFGGRK